MTEAGYWQQAPRRDAPESGEIAPERELGVRSTVQGTSDPLRDSLSVSEGDLVKYVIEYEIRTAGLTYDQNLANQDALLKAFGTWKPEAGLSVHAFLANMNNGGYVFVEADDPTVVSSFVSKYFYWNDVEVVPVIDVEDNVAIGTASLEWARTASKG